MLLISGGLGLASPALAAGSVHAPITGSGSTWSANALQQWITNVWGNYRWKITYSESGSTQGRNDFANGTADFGVSEIPYAIANSNEGDARPNRRFAYMPIVAGGTAFMYNLQIAGKRVTNLRLSGDVIAKIFTGVITRWDDAAIKADNPALALPALPIVPVVRSDGSGATAQVSIWLRQEHTAAWDAYCGKVGRPMVAGHCGVTSNYPVVAGSGFVSRSGSNGVAGYVAQSHAVGAITFVEYSYALNAGFPVAKVLNRAGYYSEPTASNVAVALLAAQINQDQSSPDYLTQDLRGVYTNADPRAYPLSSYSYIILPTALESGFTEDKGLTLADFGAYFLCEGQQQAEALGYSPLPVNLVLAGQAQIEKVPGGDPAIKGINQCHNPTLDPADPNGNALAKKAPLPSDCDRKGAAQCTTGTGGAKDLPPDQTANSSDPDGASGGDKGSGGGGRAADDAAGAGSGTGGDAANGAGLDLDEAALAADAETVAADEELAALAMAAASPQSIPAPTHSMAAQLAMFGAGLAVLGAAVLPPVLGKRGRRRSGLVGLATSGGGAGASGGDGRAASSTESVPVSGPKRVSAFRPPTKEMGAA
ncbi:MAG: phosphate ABC transporter substrate-binding protein PstS [Bifidobacteriaceae bacterium]|nr:phosphate ABC transporter substrate-binding protein PstS [Bifidobacteriaceae bacterium]